MMKRSLSTFAVATAAGSFLVAGSAPAVEVIFDDFTTNNGGAVDGQTSASTTEDGVTLTLAVSNPATQEFEGTGGGSGIRTDGEGSGDGFDVNFGEDFFLSFSDSGTLDSISVRVLGGAPNADVTFTSGSDSETVTFTGGSSFSDQTVDLDLDFVANESIQVTPGVGSDFRFRAFDAEIVVPEPGSLALVGARRPADRSPVAAADHLSPLPPPAAG